MEQIGRLIVSKDGDVETAEESLVAFGFRIIQLVHSVIDGSTTILYGERK